MDHLQDVLDGIVETLQQSQQQSTGIHTRDRSNEEYATSPILSKLSIDDCSAEMIRQLCTLYHVDYSLLKWLGLGHNAANEQCVQTEKSLNEV
jgi:DNA topoisomerase VI subunit A